MYTHLHYTIHNYITYIQTANFKLTPLVNMAHVHPGMYVYINYIYSSSWYILVCAHIYVHRSHEDILHGFQQVALVCMTVYMTITNILYNYIVNI